MSCRTADVGHIALWIAIPQFAIINSVIRKRRKASKKSMNKINWKIVAWVAVVVVVVAAVVWYIVSPGTPAAKPAVPATYAPQGQLIPNFPQQLVLGTGTAVTNSYVINYSSSTNQYTAQWDSSSSMATLYAMYKQYLPKNGWTLTNDVANIPTLRAVAAEEGTASMSVVITTAGQGSQVVLTYLSQ